MSVEFAFVQNCSLLISYGECLMWLARTKLRGFAISNSSKNRYLCAEPRKFRLYEKDHVPDQ